jgi:formylglycine-generating enzyme required for sulfatase activity
VSERPDTPTGPAPGDDGELIRPVAYQPPATGARRSRRIDIVRAAIAAVVLILVAGLWYLFTAKAVRLEFTPSEADAEIAGGLGIPFGEVWLLHEGSYRLTATAPGHHALEVPLDVSDADNQTYRFALERLPGKVTFVTTPPGADVRIAGSVVGRTPLEGVAVPHGKVTVQFDKPRYVSLLVEADIAGMEQPQTVEGTLQPDWADVTVTSVPTGAAIFVDDEPTGLATPAVVEILAGERELQLRAPGHKTHRQRLLFTAREAVTVPEIRLERADGLVRVQSTPPGAGITLNGQYQGEAPLEIAVQSGVNYRIQAFSAGYDAAVTNVRLRSGEKRDVTLSLERLSGTLVVKSEPASAELFVNGRSMGSANQSVQLATGRQAIEVRAPGYAGYSTTITPREGVTQELRVRLLTLEEARAAALTAQVKTKAGQTLVLLHPGPFTMGSSRRQPGRRANETLREVAMSRMFYLGTKEVTNAEFRKFAGDHDSGVFKDHGLNDDEQPVVNVSWQQAALYCNWLSRQEGLPPFYRTTDDKVTGIDPASIGYRLPTEAEWEWAARQAGDDAVADRPFPWGPNLKPPDRYGNFADRSVANIVGRIIFGYNDNYIVAAPVGTFAASPIGVFDLAGNVSEWVSDFHEIPGTEAVSDPLGPRAGEYHVIRGSSWMHGTVTELRLSFRDYGNGPRQDLGFRLARFAEAQ